jgi:hypothetical protein
MDAKIAKEIEVRFFLPFAPLAPFAVNELAKMLSAEC